MFADGVPEMQGLQMLLFNAEKQGGLTIPTEKNASNDLFNVITIHLDSAILS